MFEKLLEENGITAYRVAQDTGIETSTLTSWKNGSYEPKLEKLLKIADYFEVPLEYFLDGDVNDDADEEMNLVEEGEIYMNDLQVFNNTEFGKIRSVLIEDEPWFVGKDIAEALGYSKTRNAILQHVDEEDKKGALIQGGLCGKQNMIIINESGLYSLIFASKLPNAKKFKHWVTSEVLPALRKTGQYKMNDGVEEPAEKEPQKKELDYLKAAEVIAECDKTRLNTVLDLVRKAGFEVEEPRTFIPNIPQPVEQFLKGKTVEDVLNYTTRDLYLEFSTDLPYEIKNEIREADLEVYINVILGTRTVYRVVHGSSSKVFVM
jgi:prophage antirepressor-like protein/DNA-binding XRE family transcriptional regulator